MKPEKIINIENIYNGEYYIVEELQPIENAVYVTQFVNGKLESVPLPGYRVVIRNEDGLLLNHTIPNPELAAKGGKIDQMRKSFAKAIASGKLDRSYWRQYYNEKEQQITSLEYGYAVTSHKAQGSTFNNVYVFEDNILSAPGNNKSRNQALYVATSRPRKKLVIVSSNKGTVQKQVQQKQEVAPVENVKIPEGPIETSGKNTQIISFDPKEQIDNLIRKGLIKAKCK